MMVQFVVTKVDQHQIFGVYSSKELACDAILKKHPGKTLKEVKIPENRWVIYLLKEPSSVASHIYIIQDVVVDAALA